MKPANEFAVSWKDFAELILQNLKNRRNREFILRFFLLLLLPLSAFAASPADYENNPKFEEIYRIKIWNLPGGTVEVSLDKGKTWKPLGKVVYPTQKLGQGFAASRWAEEGKVAATSVNAIHIKTSTEADGSGVIFSILPKEFLKPPRVYKSYLSSDSSLYTDIPAGEGIFGGGYAPYVGDPAFVARGSYPLYPLGKWFVPAVGDKLYIMVHRPVDYPKEIVFENRFGGAITIKYFGGKEEVIGEVLRPVSGVGRFEGTKFASVGRIRANHAGVIDISTSRLGKTGGFQIVPSVHGMGMEYVKIAPQWMVIGPSSPEGSSLEGKPPFFKYFIKPAYGTDDLESEQWDKKLLDRLLVEVKLKGSDQWQSMPVSEFDEYYLTGDLPPWATTALSHITHLRILFPVL